VPWILVAVVVWGLTLFLISRRISLSTAFLFALEAAGSVLVVIVGIIVLSKGGYHGTHFGFQYFTFAGVSPSSVFLGIVIAFLGFGGFEAAAIFGEEAQTPRSVIPRTMILAVLFSGSIYVFASWFESVGFKSTAALATNPSPLVAVTLQYVGRPVAVVLGLAAAVSAFSATIANANQGSRYLFSLFRDGFISRRFANVSPGQKAPIAAILVLAVPALILSVAFFWTNPGLAFSYVAGVGGIMYTAIYLIVALVSIPWFVRRAKYGYTAVSVLAAGIVGYALYSSLIPAPPYPFNILPYGALVLIIIGIAIVGLSPQLRDSLRHSPTFKIAETGSDIPGAPSGVDA
jgi:amino acid transporter